MKQGGYIFPLIIISIVAAIYFILQTYFSQRPSENTTQLAAFMEKYPYASYWKVSNDRQVCIFYFNQCQQVPSEITFRSDDKWTVIYDYYRTNLVSEGWQTESNIVTSIPTSIILTSNTQFETGTCEMIIKEKKNNLLGLLEDKDTMIYLIKVTCT